MTNNFQRKMHTPDGTARREDIPFRAWLSLWPKHGRGTSMNAPRQVPPPAASEIQAPEQPLTPREMRCCDMATD